MLYRSIPSSFTLPTDDDFAAEFVDYTNKIAAGEAE
jgi:hypothetical protein